MANTVLLRHHDFISQTFKTYTIYKPPIDSNYPARPQTYFSPLWIHYGWNKVVINLVAYSCDCRQPIVQPGPSSTQVIIFTCTGSRWVLAVADYGNFWQFLQRPLLTASPGLPVLLISEAPADSLIEGFPQSHILPQNGRRDIQREAGRVQNPSLDVRLNRLGDLPVSLRICFPWQKFCTILEAPGHLFLLSFYYFFFFFGGVPGVHPW